MGEQHSEAPARVPKAHSIVTRRNRLRSGKDFRAVMRHGRSVARPEVVVYYSARTGGDIRFGFVVSRRVGRAVTRNRVRRLLREACRPLVVRVRVPADIVIVAREAIVGLGLVDVQGAVVECAARAGLIDLEDEKAPTT